MSSRYQIRVFESTAKDGATTAGTVVGPTVQTFSIYGYSGDEAVTSIRRDVAKGKLAKGKVYQICPLFGNPELIRSLAVGLDGNCVRVFLDPASGLYGELRRIRLPREAVAEVEGSGVDEVAVEKGSTS